MVEAALDPAYDEDASRLVGERCAERELEVGRVLVDRVALDRPRGLDRRRCRRVEVADREVDLEPQREGVIRASVGRDDASARRDRLDGAPGGARAPGDDEDRVGHAWSLTSRAAFPSAGGRRCRSGTSPLPDAGSTWPTRGT